ncbi:Ca2+-binding protein, RTX toxin-related [Loktanella atrilutea]|uniref:Ca2+-binding protein, RTX toxin-related n=1 Tax=Loktanella atrilutea TaxID=366533 RepID=A0A1M5CW59_LOKAT|nr:peroxidase family protein [Loktanella atrilutea]SHF58961.1 Ca2+-binding protein, RTX toxin-related [Loktanella atrilutea]
MTVELKPFVLNIGDITFLLDQVNLTPLFDSDGNLIMNWGGDTAIYSTSAGAAGAPETLLFDPAATPLDPAAAIAKFGHSYYSVADAAGVRDVAGVANNLHAGNEYWGATDVPFLNVGAASDLGYGHYTTGHYPTAPDYTITGNGTAVVMANVTDYTPRMITQTVMTGGVRLLLDAQNHIVHWDPTAYATDATYRALLDDNSIDVTRLVEGTAIVNTRPDVIGTYDAGLYAYGLLMRAAGVTMAGDVGHLDPAGLNIALPYLQEAVDQLALIEGHGIDVTGLNNGDTLIDLSMNPYGILAEIGVPDRQNASNGEYFAESQNPGVAPTNGFFAVFGQFFDHGLDFIGKGSSGTKITIPLDPSDPLYGVIGQDGRPTTSITISRANVDHVDENGVPLYQNHTSPYIDQSQTYGSVAQITQILREWVENPNNPGHYIPGARLLDGDKTVAWVDGFGNATTSTLPTLTELRAHILETGRADLTWADVLDLRQRDADGQLADTDAATAGVQPGGSGHALLLDMNPRVDGAHLIAALGEVRAAEVINTLTQEAASLGMSFGMDAAGIISLTVPAGMMGSNPVTLTGLAALANWINFASFEIGGQHGMPLSAAGAAAVGEVMMAAVGDHYVAGDGRVNENVALTSIHHIFHMEHDYQTQNLEIALFQQDALNGTADDHSILNDWQVGVQTTEAAGTVSAASALIAAADDGDAATPNIWVATGGILARDADNKYYVVADGTTTADLPAGHSIVLGRDKAVIDATGSYTDAAGHVSWDQERLFQGVKLVVEMEYQHTAVDQYARAVSPDIPEFSAYSTDIDATINMAYSQGAFRFGHSTLRETIDTLDPSGDMTGRIMSYALEKAFLNPALYEQVGAASLVMGMTRQVMNDIDEFVTPALQQGLLGLPMDLAAINIARGRDVGLPTLNQTRELLNLTVYTSWNDFGQNLYHASSLVNFIAAYSFDGNVAAAQDVLDRADAGDVAALNFLNGGDQSFQAVDMWIGGLAEAHISGGLLGETFNVVFVDQIQRLMDGDRFYYLYRLAGTQFGDEIINEQFKDMVERNTGTTHLNGNIFGYSDSYYELGGDQIATERLYDADGAGAVADPLVWMAGGDRTVAVSLVNASFEADVQAPGGYTTENAAHPIAGWTLTGGGGVYYPGANNDAAGHDGNNVAYLQNGGSVAQDTGVVVAAGTSYTLSVNVGDRTDTTFGGGIMRLIATNGTDTVELASVVLTEPVDGGWAVTSLSTGPVDAAYAGYTLRIEITNTSPGVGYNQVLLDQVSLTADVPGGVFDPAATYYDAQGVAYTATRPIPVDANGLATVNLYGPNGDHANTPLVAVGGHFDPAVTYYDVAGNPPDQHKYGDIIAAYNAAHPGEYIGIYTNGGTSMAGSGAVVVINGVSYILDQRPDLAPDALNTDGTPTSGVNSNEVLAGTDSDDLIYLGYGDDTGYADGGDDIVYGGGGGDRIYGGEGNDVLYGDDAPDVVDGGDGDDIIYGGDSGSSVGGFDQLIGGAGDDKIYGGVGIDKIYGNGGDDAIYGGADTDPFIFGGDGSDIVDGGDEQDNIYGNAGDDLLIGGNDKDILFGQEGDDILRPGIPAGSANAGGGNTGNAVFGPDEVVGGFANTNAPDQGFDLIDLSDNATAFQLEVNLNAQNNPLILIDQNQVLPTMIEMDGVIGTQAGDTIMGDATDNWLIGAGGGDAFEADIAPRLNGAQDAVLADRGGNDVIVGGAIRLDALIGKYGTLDGLGNFVADAYETAYGLIGANHRVSESASLIGGLLNGTATAGLYALHFTEMLRSFQFKDLVLGSAENEIGDIGDTTMLDTSDDTVRFTGNFADYSVVAVDIDGNAVTDLANHYDAVVGVRITDNGTPNADPLLARAATDGTDLVVGVETFVFADGSHTLREVIGSPPVIEALNYAGGPSSLADNFDIANNANLTARSTNSTGTDPWTSAWTESADGTNSTNDGQIRIANTANNGPTAGAPANSLVVGYGDGATISRTVDLSGIAPGSTATVSFDWQEYGLATNENVVVRFTATGLPGDFVTLETITGDGGGTGLFGADTNTRSGSATFALTGDFSSGTSVIQIDASNIANTPDAFGGFIRRPDYVSIDNLTFDFVKPITAKEPSLSLAFTEGDGDLTVVPHALITDADGSTLVSAKVVLTNAKAGDDLVVTNGTSGNGFSVAKTVGTDGSITVTLTSATPQSFDAFAARLDNIRFHNASDNPDAAPRIIQTTVNDGRFDSAPATTTISVTPVNDAPNAAAENVVTNVASGTPYLVPGWALVANDVDPDGPNPLTVTGVTENQTSFSAALSGGDVQVTQSTNNTRTFTYTVSDGLLTDTQAVNVNTVTNTTILGANSNTRDILIANDLGATLDGGTGNDIILGGAGNDSVLWYANPNGATDGQDFVDGGAGTDTFTINGNASGERFQILTTAAAIGLGYMPTHASTEIMVIRNETVIAELDNIEELVVNTVNNPGNTPLPGGTTTFPGTNGDTITVAGDFAAGTSLAYNTIHINGSDAHDTVDISGLTSAHRIVFDTQGGDDTVMGDVRPQDQVIRPQDATPPGTEPGGPQDNGPAHDNAAPQDMVLTGTDGAETLQTGGGRDVVFGGDGADNILTGAGADMIFGDAGSDRIFGGDGADHITGNTGNDLVFAGDGDDTIVATKGDGGDIYHGDGGSDTLDMAAIGVAVTVDLGTDGNVRGSVTSAWTGNDLIYHIENVVTGSGDDVITASYAVNVIDGGAGMDIFRFTSAAAADGDTLSSFQPGDTIDLSHIDAMAGTAGDQDFTITSGALTGAGQLLITEEVRDGQTFTLVQGSTDDDAEADFTIAIRGSHHLTAGDFSL